MRIMRNTRLGP